MHFILYFIFQYFTFLFALTLPFLPDLPFLELRMGYGERELCCPTFPTVVADQRTECIAANYLVT
jgi:hypothetical protein